ncbi:MAG: T9SS type A sorting domain-containing protein [Bacteroidia bacterium]|nr:T9SS type A sorting domain-containing protein [Bacteroidia bacterium]
MKKTLLLVVAWLLLSPLPSMATVFTCNTVSEIRNAMSSAVAGDEIVIEPGTYTATNVAGSGTSAYFYGSANGTASNPITIRSQSSSNRATLRGNNVGSLTVLRIVGNYWIVKDLILTTGQKGLIFDNANYCKAIDCEVHDIGYEGIHVRDGSDHVTIEGCKIYDTGKTGAGFGEGIYIGTDKGSWSTYDPSVDYTVVRDCEIGPNVRAEAFDIKEGTTETIVEGCTINAAGLSGSNFADSFIDLKGTRSYIRCNTFNRSGESNLTKGIAVIDRGVALSSYEHSIHNNTFNMDGASGNMLESYSGTYAVYGWSNTRVPAGDNYSSSVTTTCCPSWYSNPPSCGGGGTPNCTAPSGLGRSNITATSVTFSWNSVSGALNYDLRYRATSSSTWINVNNLTGTSRTQTGLSAGTTYQWQVRTSCSGTNSAFASGANFTTTASGGGGGGGASITVYSDALASGWTNNSYTGTYNLAHTTNVQVGTNAIQANYGSYGGVLLRKGTPQSLSGYTAIRFWVKSDGSHRIRVRLETNLGNKDVEFFTSSSWQQQTINLSQFGGPANVESIRLINRSGSSFTTYYDQIEFVNLSGAREEATLPASFTVMPNPAESGSTILLDFQVPETGMITLQLYDLQGRMILQRRMDPSEHTSQKLLLPSSIAPGVYLLQAQGEGFQLNQRLIVQ